MSRLLCRSLHENGWDVTFCGHNYLGQAMKHAVLDGDNEEIPYKVVGGSHNAPYAQGVLSEYFEKYRPDIFGVLLDSFMLHPWVWHPAHNFSIPCKSVGWWPSDGGWFPEGCENVLKRFDYNVMMSKFGQAQVKRLFGLPNVWHIPHGVKTDLFVPYDKARRESLRLQYSTSGLYAFTQGQYFPVRIDLREKFVVGCVARNQPRKMLDRLIRSFCLFAKGKEDVILLLHSDARDAAAGYNLQMIADRFGEGRKVYWTGIRFTDCYPTARMVDIYNLMDVHFLLTSGEGFGIPFIEAAACGVPNIATDYTTTKELITDHDAGLGVKLAGTEERPYPAEQLVDGTLVGSFAVDRAMASLKHGAQCLQRLYDERGLARLMGGRGRKAAVECYDFDKIVFPMWKRFLEDISP